MIFGLFKKKEAAPEYTVKLSYDRTKPFTKRNVTAFLRTLNIEVKTNTKARGNNGIYLNNRIDIAKGLKDEKALEVLVHEFAHYIHSRIDKNFNKTGGSLEVLFDTQDIQEIKKELFTVTNIVDKETKTAAFLKAKTEISETVKSMQKAIQRDYPEFQRSKKFKEFEKYIKGSDAEYLAKYDAVRIKTGFFSGKEKILSVKNIENDFPDMPKAFQTYIKLRSMQRKQLKISRRLNKINKYFNKPSELFARFVQGYFFYAETVKTAAPNASKRFNELLEKGYYKELKDFFEIFQYGRNIQI